MRVLVVGAGPTGLTLSLALQRRGISHRLVENKPAPSEHSKALGIQTRTLEVFERLGIADAVLAAAQKIDGAVFHLPGGDARLDFVPVHPRFPPVVALPQAMTERILLSAGVRPERGVEFIGMERGAALLRHDDGREERDEADWIVGCDGAHSAVRHAVGAGFAGAAYPEQLVLADCRIEGLEPARVHLFPAAEGTRAFFPLPNGLWRGIKVPETDETPSLAPFARPGLKLDDMVWFSAFRISRRIVTQYRFGRVVLAGDAAHIHSPVGGQGMNLGVQDAYALAAALRDGEAAVDRWATERHRVGRRVLFVTDLLTRAVTARSSFVAQLRASALRFVARHPTLVHRLERNLAGLNYPPVPE
jgi:2-polyprenyl-6-methoxyphenol hydroxylase-like FAD-dependent oxidoreductase